MPAQVETVETGAENNKSQDGEATIRSGGRVPADVSSSFILDMPSNDSVS